MQNPQRKQLPGQRLPPCLPFVCSVRDKVVLWNHDLVTAPQSKELTGKGAALEAAAAAAASRDREHEELVAALARERAEARSRLAAVLARLHCIQVRDGMGADMQGASVGWSKAGWAEAGWTTVRQGLAWEASP
jgi:hypothetical protein